MKQTPDTSTMTKQLGVDTTRIDGYLSHLRTDASWLFPDISHLATDSYYAKQTFVDGVCAWGFYLISKFRHDTNLRYLYTSSHPKHQRSRKKYDGKINLQDLHRLTPIPRSKTATLYTAVVNSVSLKWNIRLVYIWKH